MTGLPGAGRHVPLLLGLLLLLAGCERFVDARFHTHGDVALPAGLNPVRPSIASQDGVLDAKYVAAAAAAGPLVLKAPVLITKGSKAFFFEKKKQKAFASAVADA